MYAVRLLAEGYSERFMAKDLTFVYTLEMAELHDTTTGALNAIHKRGWAANKYGWPTGNGVVQVVEIYTQPTVGRVVA